MSRFMWSGGGRVVELLACGARGPGSIPRLATWILEIGYLPLPSRDMAEIPLTRRKSAVQPTNHSDLCICIYIIFYTVYVFIYS